MPTYDYRCLTCGIEFEHFQSMSSPPLTACTMEACPLEPPKKGTGQVERRISAGTGLVFRGSGFYITDYKGSSSSGSKGTAKSEGGAESKAEPKVESSKSKGGAESNVERSKSKGGESSTPSSTPVSDK